ncbi:hypothetical protein BZA05DRAFT_384343 [Tricharina praecox]|uniref:uncharacterized protein n=1 Tax=Tricharina praecox TaxID=43433 RepID=UPI00221FDD5C|nr:uncharacterized protein BZA05DRAFT_384343 [Tricharina praecox]KAI5857680.1 hypothetical protein BZA05DRAFT_384343 [Tricharina praecox]
MQAQAGNILLGCAIGMVGSIIGMLAFLLLSQRRKAARQRDVLRSAEEGNEKAEQATEAPAEFLPPARPKTPTRIPGASPPPRRKPVPTRVPLTLDIPPLSNPTLTKCRSLARTLKTTIEQLNTSPPQSPRSSPLPSPLPSPPPSLLPSPLPSPLPTSTSPTFPESHAGFRFDFELPKIDTEIDRTPMSLTVEELQGGRGSLIVIAQTNAARAVSTGTAVERPYLTPPLPLPLPSAIYAASSARSSQASYTIDCGFQ